MQAKSIRMKNTTRVRAEIECTVAGSMSSAEAPEWKITAASISYDYLIASFGILLVVNLCLEKAVTVNNVFRE